MKKTLALLVFFSFALNAQAEDPLWYMTGTTFQVPAWSLTSGGHVDSFVQHGNHGLQMKTFVGEPFSGKMDSPEPSTCGDNPCHLEIGYGFMEFYSDRLALQNVILTVNGGIPVTNSRELSLGIRFTDDLSGFLEATVTERNSEIDTRQLVIGSDNFLAWTIRGEAPDEQVPDGDYFFDFFFRDRAGNKTEPLVVTSVRLDRVSPVDGSVLINDGNLFTNVSTVTLKLRSDDHTSNTPTNVTRVKVWNNEVTLSGGVTFPFVQPEMSIQWFLGENSTGTKVVWVQFQDAAGNWSVHPTSDSIDVGIFSPAGTLSFVVDGQDVIGDAVNGFESRVLSVPLSIGWNPAIGNDLKKITISGPTGDLNLNIPNNTTPPLITPYQIGVDGDDDGPKVLTAVFTDAEGNASAPVSATINLNRQAPPDPIVVMQISTSSVGFEAHVDSATHDVRYFSFVPADGLDALGATAANINVDYSTATARYTDFGLIPNTRYSYTVRAHDDFSGSLPGFLTNGFYTLAESPYPTTPPVAVEISVMQVQWGTGNNPAGTKYQLEWCKDSSFAANVGTSAWTVNNPLVLEGLAIGTTYFLRVRARNEDLIETAPVSLGTGMTKSYVHPAPPTNFTAIQVSSTSILWTWLRSNSTEDGFEIRDEKGTVVADVPIDFAISTYTFLEADLTPNTQYHRTAFAYNHFEGPDKRTSSGPSETQNPITRPANPLPLPALVKGSQISPTWGSSGNPEDTEYQVSIALNDEFTDRLEQSEWITALIYDFPGLKPHTTYYMQVVARDRNPVETEKKYSDVMNLGAVTTETFDHARDVSLDDPLSRWRLKVPANAMATDYVVQMETDPNQFEGISLESLQRATEKARHQSSGYRFPIPGGIVQVIITSPEGAAMAPVLNQQASLIHEYLVSSAQNLMVEKVSASRLPTAQLSAWQTLNTPADDNISVRIKTLRLYVFDPVSESWIKLPNNNLDALSREVASGVNKFGVFAAMGSQDTEVNDVEAYPVPWRPNGPNAGNGQGQTGTLSAGISFVNIPQTGSVKIYDLQGGLVKEIPLSGNILEPWHGQNKNNEDVASGTYLWVTEAGGNRKIGKVMVIR